MDNRQITTSGNSDLRSRIQQLRSGDLSSLSGVYIPKNNYYVSGYGVSRIPFEQDIQEQPEVDTELEKTTELNDSISTIDDYANTEIKQDSIETDTIKEITTDTIAQANYEDSTIIEPFTKNDTINTTPDSVKVIVEDATSTKVEKPSRGLLGSVADAVFSFTEGIIDSMIRTPSGEMILNNRKIKELEFQKEFLEIETEMKALDKELNKAYLDRNTEKVRELYPQYDAFFRAYQSMLDEYRKSAGKYFDEVGHQRTARERIEAIDKTIAQLNESNKGLNDDIQNARDLMELSNRIYKPSDEWLEKEQNNWLYQIPRGLGTSATSLAATAATYAANAAANSMIAAGASGPFAPYVVGGAIVLGGGSAIASNLWARNMESLAEVAGAYEDRINEYARQRGIDTEALAEFGRDKLTELTGEDYSNRDAKAVFQDMLTYGISTGNAELDFASAEAKKGLKTLYNRNMMLAASDVAQSFIVIPGVGKVFDKALKKVDLPNRAIDGTVKLMDKTIEKIAPKISKVKRTKLMDYVVDPTLRVATTSTLEGVEEATQLLISRETAGERPEEEMELNPIDMFRMFAENNASAVKGFMGVMGISPDHALNNDLELKDNFKVGAAIGLIMGGGSQVYETTQQRRSFNAGQRLSQQILTDHIKDKEDMYKYTEYAKRATSGFLRKEDFMNAIDLQLQEGAIPQGWTEEDIQKEKQNISELFDIVRFSKIVDDKAITKEDKSIAAAYLKHIYEKRNELNDSYSELFNNLDRQSIEEDLNSFFDNNKNKILNPLRDDEKVRSLVKSFMIYDAQLNKINDIISYNEKLLKTGEKNEPVQNLLDLMYQEKVEHELNLNSIRKQAKLLKINPFLSKASLVKSNDSVTNFYFDELMGRTELEKLNKHIDEISSDPVKLNEQVIKYKESLISPEEETTKPEPVIDDKPELSEDTEVETGEVLEVTERPETKTEEPTSTTEEVTDKKEETTEKSTVEVTPSDTVTESADKSSSESEIGEPDKISEELNKVRELIKARNKGIVKENAFKQKLEVDKDSKYGKALIDTQERLASLGDEMSDILGFKKGTVISEYKLQQLVDNYDGENTRADLWNDLRILKDNLEEAIFNGDFKEADKIIFEIENLTNLNEVSDSILYDAVQEDDAASFEDMYLEESSLSQADFEEEFSHDATKTENYQEQVTSDNEAPNEIADEEPSTLPENPSPDKPTKEFTEEEIQMSNDLDSDNRSESQQINTELDEFGINTGEGTIYFRTDTKPLFDGYNDNKELAEYINIPGNIAKAEFYAIVGDKNSKYGSYNPEDVSTWDNAAIYVEIRTSDGKKFITYLKTINGIKEVYQRNGFDVNETDLKGFRDLRNQIINLHLLNPTSQIKLQVRNSGGLISHNRKRLTGISLLINDNEEEVVNRKLTEIKGLNIPSDLHNLESTGIKFGIGKGIIDNFIIMDKDGLPLKGKGGSGRIFIYPAPKDMLNGVSIPIQLNESRFSDDEGMPTELANYFAKLVLYRDSGDEILDAGDLIRLGINYSESTLIDPKDRRYPFLADKQFYFNYKEGWAQLGKTRYQINSLRNEDGLNIIAKFIADNLHWNTDKNLLFTSLPKSLRTYAIENNLTSFKIAEGLEFDMEDLGLKQVDGKVVIDEEHKNGITTIAWMIKTGKLQSDLKDNIMESPFMYVHSPEVVLESSEEQKELESESQEPVKKTFSLYDAVLGFEEEKVTEVEDEYTNADSKKYDEFFGFDGPEKRMTRNQMLHQKRINTKKAVKWLKRTLGLIDEQIEIVDGLIKEFANGSVVYGIARRDSIAISDQAIEGVQYHEAWHRVSLLMLDKETRSKIYEEFRKQHPEYDSLDNQELEEVIADRFMDYMLDDKESTFRYYIKKWFRNIKKFLHINSKLNPSELNTIFDAIKYGDFNKHALDKESYLEFVKAYETGAFYKVGPNKDYTPIHFPTLSDFDSAVDSLKACMFIANGAKYISDILNLSEDKLKQLVTSLYNSKRITSDLKEAIGEILSHFDIFMYHLRPKLQQMGIRAIDLNSELAFAEVENGSKPSFDKAAFEYDKKNNALASVKMFIATLSDTYFEYSEVAGVKTRKLKPRVNNITGLPMIVDYDTAYALIAKNLSTVETFHAEPGQDPETSLVGRCARLAKSSPFFQFLYKRLSLNMDMNLLTLILQTVKSFDLNFVEVSFFKDVDGNVSFEVKDSINKRSTKMYPSTWSDMFFNSEMIIRTDDSIKPNSEEINKVIASFNELSKKVEENRNTMSNADVDLYLAEFVKLLNTIRIDVDLETIESLFGENRVDSFIELILSNKKGSAKYLFTNTLNELANGKKDLKTRSKDKVSQLDRVFMELGRDSFINKLAVAQSITHPNDTELSVLGPNNSVMFTKTLNCYTSDLIRWLNNRDSEVMLQLNADPYCKSSRMLDVINNGGNLTLNTFVNFYGDIAGDKGRDYLSISPVEDYMAKMAFTYANHIIFPTMADKKTWFTISGVQLFNKPLYLSVNQKGKIVIKFNYEALSQLYNYWLDEYNTIVEYYNALPNLEKKDLIKNYHTSGKGGLFRHFTGYYAVKDGKVQWVDLNEALKNASKNGMDDVKNILDLIKQDLFTDKKETLNKINNILNKQLQQEIKTCEDLLIIGRDKNGKLVNKLLDNKVFEHYKLIYQQSAIEAVANNAERYAIITMIGNHMINTNVSVIETEKIITGDVAFFKNDDDKIKRLGSVLSTGDNLRTQWHYETEPDNKNSYDYLKNRQTYTATVINDNEIPSNQFEELKNLFTTAYTRNLLAEKEGLSEQQIDELMKDKDLARLKYPLIFDLAEKLAGEDASAYGLNGKKTKGNVNQADAAVYISPRMYRNIVQMLGEWSDEIAEAFDIMESAEDWLSNAELYAKTLKTLIKPLKTTYFGYTYNAKLKVNVPVFNKMAMFPMFKVLATGDNRELYDRMNALGKYKGLTPIDLVAFESAVKVGIQGPTDFYKDYHNDEINDLSKMNITVQNFRNLRRQLITDPHTHDRTLFGTQVSTVAVSNLIMDRVYGENKGKPITGEDIKHRLFGTMNAISNLGFSEVRNMFIGENGELDYRKTSKQLIREAQASNMGKDMEEALELNEDGTDFKVPLAALPDNKWIETKLITINNKKSVDLELPGGAFIQMSSFGFKQIGVEGSRLLNLREDGSMDAYISINLFSHIIPNYKDLSFTEARQWLINNRIIGENAEAVALGYRIPTQGLSSIAGLHIKDVLPSIVGDTIVLPDEFTAQTGSDFDIDKLYIARYNYETVKEEIDVTDEFEKWYNQNLVLTGEDASGKRHLISRYGNKENAKKEFVKNNKGYIISDEKIIKTSETGTVRKVEFVWDKDNPESSYMKNSREANENLLLETYLTVLTDSKNVDETRLPLDKVTGILKDEVLSIVDSGRVKGEFVPMNELSPTYQMNKKYEYSGGKTGIAPFALNNKNHVLTLLTNLKFDEIPLLQELGFTGLDGIKSRNEIVAERDDKKQIVLDENGNPKMYNDEGIRILDWISAMINAHVDVAKDPYVIRLNIRQYTYNMCNFLLRVGLGKSTFYFLPQQILKDMALAYDSAQGLYGVDETKSKTAIIRDAIKQIRDRYYKEYLDHCKALSIQPELNLTGNSLAVNTYDEDGKAVNVSFETVAGGLLSRDFLIELLLNQAKLQDLSTEEALEYYKNQLLISELFIRLNELADDMSKLVQLSQIDTKKYGNNFVDIDRFVYRLKSLMVNTQLFTADDIQNYLDNTFLSTKLDNGLIKISNIFEPIMLRSKQSFKDIISQILMMTNRIDSTDSDLNKLISNELEALLKYKFIGDVDVFSMFYGQNTMAKRLSKIKIDILNGVYPEMLTQDGKISNQLLNYLGVLTKMSTDNYEAPDIIIKNRMSSDDKYLKQNLISYWEELLDSPHEEIRKFANDLLIYQLITTGGNNTKNGIFNLTPISLIQSSGYSDFMRSATSNFDGRDIDFDNFFLNNWLNNKLVPVVKLFESDMDDQGNVIRKSRHELIESKDRVLNGNRIPLAFVYRNAQSIATNLEKQPVYTPYLKYRVPKVDGPAGTLLYKFVGVAPASNGNMAPLYVLVDKKGLNQGGRVVKEYDSYSNSMFEFNNVPNNMSMSAKQIIMGSDISNFLQENGFFSNQKVKDEWLKKLRDFEETPDYLPLAKALNTDLHNIMTPVKKQTRVLGQFVVSNIAKETEEQVDNVNIDDRKSTNEPFTFTFSDGIKIEVPFKLNQQQEEALLGLEDFIKHPSKYNNMVTLEGYAGTGKTTIISLFDKYLQRRGRTPIYSAPTHRANAVTKQNNPDAIVKTLHSLFGLSPRVDLEDGTYDLRKLKTELVRPPKDLNAGTLLIIDESSMVSEGLYEFIRTFVDEIGIKVIFIGDPAQLSPVKDTSISPVFTRENATVFKLNKVERTGDNPILEEATNLRNGKPLSYETKVINGEGVEYMSNDSRPNQVITEIVNSEEYKKNPFYFRILSATNAMLPDANNRVREMLYGKNADLIVKGEVLMGFANIRKRNELVISNSIDYVVTDVSKKTTKILDMTLDGYEISMKPAAQISDNSDLRTVFVLSNEISDLSLLKIANHIEALERSLSKAFETRQYGMVDVLLEQIANLKLNTITMRNLELNGKLKLLKVIDYGYAHTIHKSQGGTYDKVMIYEDTINNAAFDVDVKQQLRYVAVSRAKHNVYIVTSRPFTDKTPSTPVSSEQMKSKVFNAKFNYNRQLVEEDSRTLYIFTDNSERTSQGTRINEGWYKDKYQTTQVLGYGSDRNPTTAVIRGLDNAAPISTVKWFYRNHIEGNTKRDEIKAREASLWTDTDYDTVKAILDDEINDIKLLWDSGDFDKVVLPRAVDGSNGILNGKISKINKQRTPRLYELFQSKIKELKEYVNGYAEPEEITKPQTILTEVQKLQKATLLTLPIPSEFKCHSGGADGADFMWGEIGKEYGLPEANHYQHPEKKSPHGNIDISSLDIQEGRYKVAQAAKSNYGYQYQTMKDGNLIRDWALVKYSDAIFAVGHIVTKGLKLFPSQSNDTRLALHTAVTGGTGYAVEMARLAGKPIYVFDQERNAWYTYSYELTKWLKTGTPTLTRNFAGIGTRELKQNGILAIRDTYTKTFGNPVTSTKQESKSDVFDLTTAASFDAAEETNQTNNTMKTNEIKSISDLLTTNNEAIEQMVLYSKGHNELKNRLNEMQLDENLINSKIRQFEEALKSENINSEEQMEGLINRIICN